MNNKEIIRYFSKFYKTRYIKQVSLFDLSNSDVSSVILQMIRWMDVFSIFYFTNEF